MKTIDEIANLIAKQRKKLGIEQKDMYLRIGMKQQYQRIESGNDIKFSTLQRMLEGLGLALSIKAKYSNVNLAIANMEIANKSRVDLDDDVDDLDFWFKKGNTQ
ncbi:helix-turn-helix domain-containing protein [Proteus vulgaris]|uniref:helix-turn-helix domain-containing protein n=1 Tax=Proteus vulgaris TaxID=585 RepID=UPI0018E4AB7B|nr:helix-turn-helix domain-containing protein [Proteus vulgaris]MBI6529162.1 helix-turn-helix domain-containing protein [Proteus vulgaris]